MAYTPSLADLPPPSQDEQKYHPSLQDVSPKAQAAQGSSFNLSPSSIFEAALPGGILKQVMSGLTPKALGIGLASGLESVAEPTRRLEQGALNKINQGLGTNLNLLPTSQILSPAQEQTPAAQLGRFLGPLVATAPLAGPAGAAESALARVMPKLLARGILSPAEGAGIGAFFDPNAKRGAETGALLGPATELGVHLGTRTIPSPFKKGIDNLILRHLRRAVRNRKALAPEEAAQKVAAKHTNPDGSFAPMNLADVSENNLLKGVDSVLQYFPGSGAKPTGVNPYDLESFGRNYLDNLVPGLTNRPKLEENLATHIKEQGKHQKDIGSALYSPINKAGNSTLAELAKANTLESSYPNLPVNFPQYENAARELIDNREELANIFGDDNDLNSSLRQEFNKADSLINGNIGDVTLGNLLDRIKKSGELGRALTKRGHDNAARLMNGLHNGLSTDLKQFLKNSNRPELADQLEKANTHWRENVIPYTTNRVFRKALSGQVPKDDKLAKELFDPNNPEVWRHTPDSLKNAALKLLFTKGKGTAKGLTNLSAPQMANAYENSLKSTTKNLINEFNPEANLLFERLSAQSPKTEEQLAKALEQEKKDQRTERYKLAAELTAGATAGYLQPWLLASAAALPYSRMIAQRLRSPELIARYLRGDTGEMAQSSPLPAMLGRGMVARTSAMEGNQ